jgi:hypothetical protein
VSETGRRYSFLHGRGRDSSCVELVFCAFSDLQSMGLRVGKSFGWRQGEVLRKGERKGGWMCAGMLSLRTYVYTIPGIQAAVSRRTGSGFAPDTSSSSPVAKHLQAICARIHGDRLLGFRSRQWNLTCLDPGGSAIFRCINMLRGRRAGLICGRRAWSGMRAGVWWFCSSGGGGSETIGCTCIYRVGRPYGG